MTREKLHIFSVSICKESNCTLKLIDQNKLKRNKELVPTVLRHYKNWYAIQKSQNGNSSTNLGVHTERAKKTPIIM